MYNSFNSSTDGSMLCIFMTLIKCLVFGVLKKMLVVHKLHRDACVEYTVLVPLQTVLYVWLEESWTAHANPEMHTHQGKSRFSTPSEILHFVFVSHPHWPQKRWIIHNLIKANLKQNIFSSEVNGSPVGKGSYFFIFPGIDSYLI